MDSKENPRCTMRAWEEGRDHGRLCSLLWRQVGGSHRPLAHTPAVEQPPVFSVKGKLTEACWERGSQSLPGGQGNWLNVLALGRPLP